MQCQEVFEQCGTQPALQTHDEADRLFEYRGEVAFGSDVATELLGDALLFAPLQLQKDVFLGGEVKEEGSVRDASGCHDGADVSRGGSGSLELGDRSAHQPFASLKTFRFAR